MALKKNTYSDERLTDRPWGSSTDNELTLHEALSHHAYQDIETQVGPEHEPLKYSDKLHWELKYRTLATEWNKFLCDILIVIMLKLSD